MLREQLGRDQDARRTEAASRGARGGMRRTTLRESLRSLYRRLAHRQSDER